MKIVALKACQIRVPLRRKITHASHSRSESQSILVRCQLDDGTTGWGEAVPRPYVTGETAASVMAQYQLTDFRRLADWHWNSLNDLVTLCTQLMLSVIPDAPSEYLARGCFGNAARCALELSLLDAACRSENVPLSAIFENLDPENKLVQHTPQVNYSAVLSSMKPVKQSALALLYRFTGFQHCKVKVGLPGIDDFKLLQKVRRQMGRRMGLRVDANEAWSRQFLENHDEDFKTLAIQSIEQPVPHQELSSLKQMRGQLSTPIMLDESLCSSLDAEHAVAERNCDAFNLRISKLGGLIPTLKLAQFAQEAGIRCQLGCQVGETGILSAAGRHFATSIQGIDFLEGSFDRYLLKQNIIDEDISFQWGGRADALKGPGLGITVNEQKMDGLLEQEMLLI